MGPLLFTLVRNPGSIIDKELPVLEAGPVHWGLRPGPGPRHQQASRTAIGLKGLHLQKLRGRNVQSYFVQSQATPSM